MAMEKERDWMQLALLLIVAVNGDGEVGCFGTLLERIVALDDTSVEADERIRVEEFRVDTREAKAAMFLDAVDEKVIMVSCRGLGFGCWI